MPYLQRREEIVRFRGVVHQKKYRLTFQQLRPADENEPLGEALTEAIRQGLEQVVQTEKLSILYFWPFIRIPLQTTGHSPHAMFL